VRGRLEGTRDVFWGERLGAVGALTGSLVMLGSFQHDCMLLKTGFQWLGYWLGAAHSTFSVSSRVHLAGQEFRPILSEYWQAQNNLNASILRASDASG
jgi:hypothetical protein